MESWKVCIALLVLSTTAEAHVDSLLPIAADGSILEVPDEFGKVRLVVSGLGSEGAIIQLTIGKNSTALPSCVSRLIKSRTLKHVEASGSWYHNIDKLPPYLEIRFFKPSEDPKATFRSSQDFMFNLRNGKLIVGRSFAANGNGGKYQYLKLPLGCKLEIAR